MYKFVIPDTKRKQNDFFEIFWNIDQVLVALITWLLKLKYMLTHIFDFLSYENTISFFVVLRLGHMHENKIFFYFLQRFDENQIRILMILKYKPILIKMDRKICRKITNFRNDFFFFKNLD